MSHLRLIPKRDLVRHELEQQLDALAREYGVTKDKKVFRADATIVRAAAGVKKNVEPCRRPSLPHQAGGLGFPK
jgi:hypothetical protein